MNGRKAVRRLVSEPESKYCRRDWTILDGRIYKYQSLCVLRAGEGKSRTYFLYALDNCLNLSGDIPYDLAEGMLSLKKEGILDGRYLLVPRVLEETDNPWQDAWDACADSYRRRVAHKARAMEDLLEMELIGRSMQIMASSMRSRFVMRDGDRGLLALARKLTRALKFLGRWHHIGGEDYEG